MTAVLDARAIKRSFGPIQVLHGVDFSLVPGEIHALIGENGAGKSTTMRMLTGYLYPDAGHARIGGAAVDDPATRARVGYLPEHTPLYREMRVDRYLRFVAGTGRRACSTTFAAGIDATKFSAYGPPVKL